jgi:radical SAM superfamily enzyme
MRLTCRTPAPDVAAWSGVEASRDDDFEELKCCADLGFGLSSTRSASQLLRDVRNQADLHSMLELLSNAYAFFFNQSNAYACIRRIRAGFEFSLANNTL